MMFTKRLREGVRSGEITRSVRIWMSPRVIAGNRYRMGEGQIEVNSIEPICLPDITPQLARESGFLGVLDLLKVAKHGKGEKIFLARFHYIPPKSPRSPRASKRASPNASVPHVFTFSCERVRTLKLQPARQTGSDFHPDRRSQRFVRPTAPS